MLNGRGDFYPYAALDRAGTTDAVAAPIRGGDPGRGRRLVALHDELREQAADGAIRASGIAADGSRISSSASASR